MEGEGDGRRAGVAAWRERVREEEQGCKFPFPLRRPLPLAAPPPPVLGSISKAAGALSSTTDKLGGKAEAFSLSFLSFFEMTCKCDTSHPEWASCFLHQFQR